MTGNFSPRYLPKKNKNMSTKTLIPNVHSSFTYRSPKLGQSKCSSTGECVNKLRYTQTMKFYSVMKRNELLICVTT